jgi:hypothetical protein
VKREVRWGLLIVFVAVLATAAKHYLFNWKLRKPNAPPFSPSTSTASQAKQRHVWVCDMAAEPNPFRCGQREVRVREAWVERAIDDEEYFLVWIPYAKRNDWSFLCVSLAGEDGTTLTLEGEGGEGGFAMRGVLYWLKLPPHELAPMRVRVRSSAGEDCGVVTFTAAEEEGQVNFTSRLESGSVMRKVPLVLVGLVAVLGAAGLVLWLTVPRSRITKESFDAIEVGMTEQEVEAILGRLPGDYSGGRGPPQRMSLHFSYYHHASSPYRLSNGKRTYLRWVAEQAEVGVFFDVEGRVTLKHFNPAESGHPEGPVGKLLHLLGR